MTCIVGLTDKNKVYIGGDAASANAYVVRVSAVPKVFRNGPFVIGYTSSWRMGQILQYHLRLDGITPPKAGDCLQELMVREFVEGVRQALKEYAYAEEENNRETGGEFLVGYNGHLFHIGDDYQVNETIDGIDACGCGAEVALGALYATRDTKLTPFQRIDNALEAAAHFSKDVRPPFRILELGERLP